MKRITKRLEVLWVETSSLRQLLRFETANIHTGYLTLCLCACTFKLESIIVSTSRLGADA